MTAGDGMTGAPADGDAPATIYTIGHSTRTADEFVALLREHGVRRLVDVRRFPGSRRHPQFGREALAATLAQAGIDYRHEEALGGRRGDAAAAGASPNTAWRHPAFRAYADYTATPPFQAALHRLLRDGAERRTTLMCAEAVPWRCHRQFITDALLARGVRVTDILGPGEARPAVRSEHATPRADGTLIYPATPQRDLFGE